MMKFGVYVDPSIGIIESSLMFAITKKDYKISKYFLEIGLSSEFGGQKGASRWASSALHLAAENEDISILQLLINHGAKFDDWSDFRSICMKGKAKSLIYLLGHLEVFSQSLDPEMNSSLDQQRALSKRVINATELKNIPDISLRLRELGFDVDANDDKGNNLLSTAAKEGHYLMVELLLDLGANVNPPKVIPTRFRYDNIPPHGCFGKSREI
jgi:ankyrin repeat protein